MRKRRNWLKTTIAMLTLIATVVETGFSSVSTLAAEIETESGITVNNDAVEEADTQVPESEDLNIEVESDGDYDAGEAVEAEETYADEADYEEEQEEVAETYEEAAELKDGILDVSDDGITGSGYDEISIYVNTEELSYKRSFRIEFFGPDSSMYNPVINDNLYRTNAGRYDFEDLEGGDFTIRATSDDKVNLSYRYNEDGYPEIVVENAPADKVLNKKDISFENGTSVAAIVGEGYESLTLDLVTEELSDNASYKLFVDTVADATVDGQNVTGGIGGLDNRLSSLVIEGLDEEPFTAYIVSDNDEFEIQTVAAIEDVEEGIASFTIDNQAVKRVYEFEDAKIKVTATLEKADAVPDDAVFNVEPLTEEEAEAYLAALNKDKGEEDALATADNTLLYNIGFFTDESKTEEIEPEEGSVTVSIEFKRDQLTEEIGAEDPEEIIVTHIIEEGSNITTEVVADAETSIDEGTIEFTTDSFSLYAIQYNGSLKFRPGTARDFKVALGKSVNYGLVANEITLAGHNETNFATKKLNGNADMNSCKNNGGGTGYTYIGEYTGSKLKITGNGNKGQVIIYTTPQAKARFNSDQEASGTLVDTTSYSQDDINALVKEMIDEAVTNSTTIYNETNYYDFSEFKDKINTNPGDKMYLLDLASKGSGDGTYYFRFKNGEFGDWSGSENGLKIKITKGQTVVFNIPDTNVELKKNISLVIDNKSYSSDGSNNEMGQHLIYNMPYAKKVDFNGNVDGVFICPKASASVNQTSGGWLVAETIPHVGGAEWHATWPGIPETRTESKQYDFQVTKVFNDEAGDVSHWPAGGFQFTIEEYKKYSTDRWNSPTPNAPMPANKTITIIKGANGNTNKGSFGKLTFDAEKIYNLGKKLGNGSTVFDGDATHVNYMYLIKEVIPSGAQDYTDANGNKVYYADYLDRDAWDRPKQKIKYKVKDGVVYDCEPWTLKLWINVKKVQYGNYTEFKIQIDDNIKQDHEDHCTAGPTHPITFTNFYEGPVEVPVTLEGIKYINKGTDNIPDNAFEFSLYEYIGSNNWGRVLQKAKNKGSVVKFEPFTLNFGKGTENNATQSFYYFLIQETGCDENIYKKDGSSTIAKVILTKNGTNYTSSVEYYRFKAGETILVTKAMSGDTSFKYSCSKFDFWNEYEASGKTTIGGTKYMEGRILTEHEYTFSLSEVELGTDGRPVKGADGKDKEKLIETVNNISNITSTDGKNYSGEFGFSEISYGLADIGTHLYRVREVEGTDPNVEYDTLVKEVTVTVSAPANYSSKELGVTRVPEDGKVSFTNTYNPPEGGLTFKATKLSDSAKVKGTFKFILEEVNGTTVTQIDEQTAEVGKTAVFDEITYDVEGEHTYRIREYIPGENDPDRIPGVVYDTNVYTATVTVKDNGKNENGKHLFDIDVAGDFSEDTPAGFNDPKNPIFVNDFDTQPGEVVIGGEKDLKGKALTPGKFQFTITDMNPDSMSSYYTMSEPFAVTNNDNGAFEFGKITFTNTGDYKFLVSENRAYQTDEEIIYTDKYYIVNVHVTDNDGNGHYYTKLKCEKSYEEYTPATENVQNPAEDTHASKDKIKFINKKWNPGSAIIEASKLYNGQTPGEHRFTFHLLDANHNQVFTRVNGVDVEQTKYNDANGNVLFDTISYSLADYEAGAVKTYYIKEEVPSDATEENGYVSPTDGVKYDPAEHKVTVTLTKTEQADNTWKIDAEVAYDNTVGTTPEFKNEYSANGRYDIPGEKILRGRDFNAEDDFSFYLYREEDLDNPIAVEPLTKETGIFGGYTKKGTFNFSADSYPEYLTFVKDKTKDQTGTYRFRLYERGTGEGITNDDRYFKIVLTVEDKGDGNLIVSDTITPVAESSNGTKHSLETFHTIVKGLPQEPGKITFTNTYTEKGETFFEANKIVKDSKGNTIPIGDKKFKFELQDKAGNRVGSVQENDGTGKITFDTIQYKRDQISESPILYSIHETSVKEDGYTPDSSVFIAQADLVLDETDPENVIVVATPSYYKAVSVESADGADVTVDFGNGVVGYYKKGSSVSGAAVTFENVYEAEGHVVIPVTKTLIGRDMSEDEFSADLIDENGENSTVYDTVNFPASKDGKAVTVDFKQLDYTIADLNGASTAEKYYTIVEHVPTDAIDGVLDGIKYVDIQYRVVVTLTDLHNGEIDVKWVAYENGTTYKEPKWWQKLWDTVTFTNRDHKTEFVNYYTAVGKLELSAKKAFFGRTLDANDEFIFILKKPDGTEETRSTKTDGVKQSDGTIKVTFDAIEYDRKTNGATHDYEYTIVEQYKGQTRYGIHYSNDEYKINVTVADDTKGKLGITGTINGTAAWTAADVSFDNNTYIYKPEAVTFTNIYVPDDLSVSLGGDKSLSGRDLKEGDVFSFKLKKADDSEKAFTEQQKNMVAGKDLHSGKFKFDPIVYTPDDLAEDRDENGNILTYAPYRVFKYEVSEVIPDDTKGITYDETKYTVTVVVINNNGKLSASVYRGDVDGAKVAAGEPIEGAVLISQNEDDQVYYAVEFTNIYEAAGAVTIPARKIVDGRKTDDEFTFKITSDKEGKNVLRTLTVKGDGVSADFLADECKDKNATEKYTFKYDLNDKGEHVYYIMEDVPAKDSKEYKDYYDYSETVYKATVTVDDNGEGQLVATPVYTLENAGNISPELIGKDALYLGKSLEFVNKYNATGSIVITGKKQLNIKIDGKDTDILTVLPNHDMPEFTFRLYNTDANGKITDMIAETKSDKKTGEFMFDLEKLGITYTLDHVGKKIQYKVVEVAPENYDPDAVIGMKYDLTEYDVFVEVNDKDDAHKDGTLDINKTIPQMDTLGAEKQGWFDAIKHFFMGDSEKPDILVINDYDSVGYIDPPVLTKTLMGRVLERGEFEFKVTGAYEGTAEDLLKAGTLTKLKDDPSGNTGKNETIRNGYASDGSTRHIFKNPVTGEVTDVELGVGELYVGDITYKWEDLYRGQKFDENNKLYEDFVYKAVELVPSDTDTDNIEYTGVELYLFVHAVDEGDGTITTTGHGKNGALVWESLEKDENGTNVLKQIEPDDFPGMFINKFKTKGFIDILGSKELIGRELTKDDIFEFTIKDIENYEKAEKAGEDPSKFVYTVNNTTDKTDPNGAPKVIAFTHDKVPFLNYEWGYGEDPFDDSDDKDDTAFDHNYRIDEKFFDENGITSDERYYIVTVHVELPKDAKGEYDRKSSLIPKITDVKRYLKSGQLDDSFKFAPTSGKAFWFENPFNMFADIEFAGTKQLTNVGTGKAVAGSLDGLYGFELVEYSGENYGDGAVIASATTDKDGNYVIRPVKDKKAHFFDQDDMYVNGKPVGPEGRKYNFGIREILPSNGTWVDNDNYECNGVIYDTSTYFITVTLKYGPGYTLIPEVTNISRAFAHGGGIIQYKAEDAKDLNYANRTKGYDFNNKVRDYVSRSGKKIWRDNLDQNAVRDPITINLMRNGVKINSTQAKAPDWTYEFTTDQNGNKLPACDVRGKSYDYTVDEDPVAGYDSAVRLNEDGTIDFINTKGDILIKKIDADTGLELAGATLAIYDGSTQIEQWVSEIGAHEVKAQLTAGKTYTLRELSVPEGYEIAADVNFVVPTDGSDITVTMSDKPIIGSVRLIKRDAATREALAGAEFALYKDLGGGSEERVYATGSAGSYRASKSTSNGVFAVDSTGSLNIADLPYGTYYFVETKAPEGYTLSSERLGFSIVKGGELVEVTFLNPKAVGSVRLRKVGSTGVGGLAGATFELYAKTPRTVGQAASSTIFRDAYYRVGTYHTDSSGYIYVDNLPWDDYYFVEVDAPRGYVLGKDVNGDDLVFTFTINAASTSTTIDLGGITNFEEEYPPETPTPTPTPGVLGERVRRGGVVNGVLGVRSKPTSGVLGERVGPVTGDASNIILWLLLLTACVATIVATVMTGRKKKAAK